MRQLPSIVLKSFFEIKLDNVDGMHTFLIENYFKICNIILYLFIKFILSKFK